MKLATLKDGSRDGQLVVVSTDLTKYTPAGSVAGTMRDALDNWQELLPRLLDLSERLNLGQIASESFEPELCMAPLPRASQWADGSAYVNHVELVRKARGAEMPSSFWEDPLMYMGAPDAMLGPRDDIVCASEGWGIDMEAEVAVVIDDVKQGTMPEQAQEKICLVMILNDVSFRNLIAPELQKGFGFFQSKGPTAFSPVAVTPDELGEYWQDGMVHRPMMVAYNEKPFGNADANVDMTFNFSKLISHAAKTRDVCAGSIVGSGTISNRDADGGPGKPIDQGGKGYSCIAEIRVIETINDGKPSTEFMKFGDRVRVDMQDDQGNSIFGAIDQKVVQNI